LEIFCNIAISVDILMARWFMIITWSIPKFILAISSSSSRLEN